MGTLSLDDVPNLATLSREDAHYHQQTVADLLHRQTLKFPGAQPVSFNAQHLEELHRVDYFVAEKTDGIRLLLYLTAIHDGQGGSVEAQYLIDRKNEYHFVKPGWIHIPPPNPEYAVNRNAEPYLKEGYHIGTILDGELVRQKFKDGRKQLTFLVFDCLAMDGEDMTQRTFDIRIGKVHRMINAWQRFVKDWPTDGQAQPFQLAVKEPELGYGAPKLFKEKIPNLPHGNDGLIYTCKVTPYKFGTDDHILKWKPPKENTIDFRLQIRSFPIKTDDQGEYEDFHGKPEIDLLVYHGDKGYQAFQGGTKLYLTDTEWEAVKGMQKQIDWRIIECWREKETGHWRPKIEPDGTPRFRDDKDHANHISVVESVLESIEDAVSEEDLIAAYDSIRTAWKAREAAAKRQQQDAAAQRQRQKSLAASAPAAAPVDEDDGPGYAD